MIWRSKRFNSRHLKTKMDTKLNINDQFKITTGYGKRILTVAEIQADGCYRCTDEVGEAFFISPQGIEVYAGYGQFVVVKRAAKESKLANFLNGVSNNDSKAETVEGIHPFALRDQINPICKDCGHSKKQTQIASSRRGNFQHGVTVVKTRAIGVACECGEAAKKPSASFSQAASQVLQTAIVGVDEKTGGRIYAAWEKAYIEALENDSIQFENGILRFTSRDSHEPRIVTRDGCSDLCACKGRLSYHVFVYRIIEAARSNVVAFPVRSAKARRLAA